ncbi:twin-arginine translocase subunit TatC [Deinococcus radiophilus]|uniref:Sec-independent protein translocase protein TatC n=2 Tax=Deinococcus radiophilus TaxID=32062 RepID=A0A3S0I7V8_9DEIO|nr:twin-arginine translocase subunit TatC [Deinococcus radiophilus]RTR29438.1 twin-arginine translocase subunit TatC [Deinococcus radiophilus]UFA50729.1 twin-arginine translocase subunit TatC [Deinococcus radiophilus]
MTQPPAEPNAAQQLQTATLLEHLGELRTRLIWSVAFLAVGMGVAFTVHQPLLALLKAPLNASAQVQAGEVVLISTTLTGQFMAALNLSFWAGMAIALPLILTQVWAFIAPGLYAHERRWAVPFILGAGVAFAAGVAFGYTFVLPAMIRFFLDFLAGQVQAMPDVAQYIGMVVTFLVAFGLSFELPILAVLLTRIGLINHHLLRRGWRVALVGILILAALITPTPDPGTMLLVAGPLYVLYELSIVLSRIFQVKVPDDDEPVRL